MTPLELVLIGVMASWTPSLVLLAVLLWRTPVEEFSRRSDRR